ncbi:hypothetical protein MMK73_002977 [Providencia rettgeri]|nr:hypothetical protein [Providencia rettgeri]
MKIYVIASDEELIEMDLKAHELVSIIKDALEADSKPAGVNVDVIISD